MCVCMCICIGFLLTNISAATITEFAPLSLCIAWVSIEQLRHLWIIHGPTCLVTTSPACSLLILFNTTLPISYTQQTENYFTKRTIYI